MFEIEVLLLDIVIDGNMDESVEWFQCWSIDHRMYHRLDNEIVLIPVDD